MRLLLCPGLCVVTLFAGVATAGAAVDFAPCPGTPDFECGAIAAPLDPSGGQGGTLRLAVQRAVATREATDVLVALGGGPGQSATRFLEDFSDVLAEALENRQLVVLDQRGTGNSRALRCPALDSGGTILGIERLTRQVGRCGAELGDTRRFYTSTEVVEDLEALRRSLGVERISIFGISYGAYVAQRYARRYPAAVDRLVLDSPVAQDQGGPFDVSSYAAIPRMLREVCDAGRCRGVTRYPVGDLRRLAARLPLRGRAYDARGRARSLTLHDEGELFDLFASSDFSPPLRAALPAAVRSAVLGDAAPLLRSIAIDAGLADPHAFDEDNEDVREFSNALYFATTCQEKPLPWRPDAPLSARTAARTAALADAGAGAFAPFGPAAAGSTLVGSAFCRDWPPTRVAPPPAPGPIAAPALIVSGELDVRTPTAEAAQTARWIRDSALVRVPDAGHSLVSSRLPCVTEAIMRFFAEQSVGNPCADAESPEAPAPVAPARLPRGRAVVETIADAARALAAHGIVDTRIRFGGLRGGRACARPGELGAGGRRDAVLMLHGYAYVPRLAVSGTVRLNGGRAAAIAVKVDGKRGSLRLRGGRLTGTVAGHRIRVAADGRRFARPIVAASPLSSRPCR